MTMSKPILAASTHRLDRMKRRRKRMADRLMKLRRIRIMALMLMFAACGPLPKPEIVSESPSFVAYEYTHWYWSLDDVKTMAHIYCQRYGKTALIVDKRWLNLDRSRAYFNCAKLDR